MSTDEAGWVAECQNCPTTTSLEYGHEVKVRREFPTICEDQARMWRVFHMDHHPGHEVRVGQFFRATFTEVEEIEPEIWRRIFGV